MRFGNRPMIPKEPALRSSLAILAAAALTLSGCKSKQMELAPGSQASGITAGQAVQAPAPQTIAIDGSSTVFPISEAVAEDFQKQTGFRVTVAASGTGGGFKKFCSGELDVAGASRPIKAAEFSSCQQKGVEFIELPVAFDGIAVVVNPKNSFAQDITVAELKTLWAPEAQGVIKTWKQVRTSWPDQEIHLFGAGVDSGTYDYFTLAIVGKEHASRGDYTSSEDDNVLVQGIATDPAALGFFGFSYYAENKDKLRALSVDDGVADNGAGAMAPNAESINTGSYQPLSRPLFIYISKAAAARPEVAKFGEFYLTTGPALVAEVGCVKLPAPVYALGLARLQQKTVGSLYGRGSQIHVKLEELMTAAPH